MKYKCLPVLFFLFFFLEAQLIRIHCVDNSSSLKSVISYSIVYTCTLIIERTENISCSTLY